LVKYGTVPELVGPSQTFEIHANNVSSEALQRATQQGFYNEQQNGHALLRAESAEQLNTALQLIRDGGGHVLDVKGHSETLEDVFVRSVRSDGR
jgi:hypothetical protein